MEGIAGVVSEQQLGPAGFEYARFREFMTAEVLAAIAGAREAGATEIVVGESLGDVEGAVVKRAISFHSAATMTPEAAQALIRQRVRAGLGRRASFRPYKVA